MASCCVIQCRLKKNKTLPRLSLHKFPVNRSVRKKWIEIIGAKNINRRNKTWFVCSLHFEESCFNRTRNVIRLHNGAVPSSSLLIYDINKSNLQKTESYSVKVEVPEDTIYQDSSLVKISDIDNKYNYQNTKLYSVKVEVPEDTIYQDSGLVKISDIDNKSNFQKTESRTVKVEVPEDPIYQDSGLVKIQQQNKGIETRSRRRKFLTKKEKCLNAKVLQISGPDEYNAFYSNIMTYLYMKAIGNLKIRESRLF